MSEEKQGPTPTSEAPDWLHFFVDEFNKESDRAAVILASAIIDDTLKDLLQSCLLSCTSSNDPLFDSPNSPLSSFSSRIEFAFRLGLINRDFTKALTILRRIRNSFAHDVVGCTLSAHSTKNRIDALIRLTNAKANLDKAKNIDEGNPRHCFIYVAGLLLWLLKHRLDNVTKCSDEEALNCVFSEKTEVDAH